MLSSHTTKTGHGWFPSTLSSRCPGALQQPLLSQHPAGGCHGDLGSLPCSCWGARAWAQEYMYGLNTQRKQSDFFFFFLIKGFPCYACIMGKNFSMATPATPPLLALPTASSTRQEPMAHPHTGSSEEHGHGPEFKAWQQDGSESMVGSEGRTWHLTLPKWSCHGEGHISSRPTGREGAILTEAGEDSHFIFLQSQHLSTVPGGKVLPVQEKHLFPVSYPLFAFLRSEPAPSSWGQLWQ